MFILKRNKIKVRDERHAKEKKQLYTVDGEKRIP